LWWNAGTEGRHAVVTPNDRSYTVVEAAGRLGASQWTVLHWLRAGRLRGYRLGGPKLGWRGRESDIERFIEAAMNRPVEESEPTRRLTAGHTESEPKPALNAWKRLTTRRDQTE